MDMGSLDWRIETGRFVYLLFLIELARDLRLSRRLQRAVGNVDRYANCHEVAARAVCIFAILHVSKRSININTFAPQLLLCNFNLSHQFFVRLWHIVECEHAPAKLEQEIRAEGHQSPKGELDRLVSAWVIDEMEGPCK